MPTEETDKDNSQGMLELLYNISRELSYARDLHTLLERLLLLSLGHVGAMRGSIIVIDDQGSVIDSIIVTGDEVHHKTTRQLNIVLNGGLAGWVVHNRQSTLIPDTSQDARWMHRPDDASDQTGPKSALSAPLIGLDNLVGVMTLVHPTPNFFTPRHQTLFQSIADQAGIAVLNARLYDESQHQARTMTALVESAAIITATLRMDEVWKRILEQINQALQVESVSLALTNTSDETVEYQATTAQNAKSLIGFCLKLGEGVAGWVAKENQGVVISDVNKDTRFLPILNGLVGFTIKAVACTPIRLQETSIGVIEAVNPIEGYFKADALLILETISNLAGTAIRHAQLFDQLQRAHQRYRELFENSIDPILITDWKGNILEANRRAVLTTQYSQEALKKINIIQLHSLDENQVGKNFEILTVNRTVAYESYLRPLIGIEVPVQVNVQAVEIENNSSLQWILRDITAEKKLESMRNDLISMIYHDLRSPLGNVVSSLDVLESMLPRDSEPALVSLLNIAVRSTERIQRLTNSLLDINRLEAGQPVGNRQLIAPATLVDEAVEAALPIAQNKNLHLTSSLPKNLPQVDVDPDMIKRVLLNLVENAVKFTPPGGNICVGAKKDGEWVNLWVQDSGIGVSETDKERIFEKYTSLQRKEGPKGIGLGLAYCRLAVEGHGGHIWVESEPGLGARFNFTLPIIKLDESA